MKRIVVNQTKCTGCRTCETFCSYSHEKLINPSFSRISIINPGVLEEKPYAVVCRQCEEPACGEACPEDALYYDKKKQMVVYKEEDCIQCGLCAKACSFGAISMHREKNTPIKCNLCDGEPVCITYCLAQAIHLEEVFDEILIKKRRY